MVISEISAIVDRLNLELNQNEQKAVEGANLTQQLLSRFVDNALLAQYFAYYNTILFFLKVSQIQIGNVDKIFNTKGFSPEAIATATEELTTLEGLVLEIKDNLDLSINSLNDWQKSEEIPELEEALEITKITEQKTRGNCELSTAIAWKYQKQI
ncbi:MAG: hypothetical protein ACFBSE_14035 [Prochloraceae cyanobacterium]